MDHPTSQRPKSQESVGFVNRHLKQFVEKHQNTVNQRVVTVRFEKSLSFFSSSREGLYVVSIPLSFGYRCPFFTVENSSGGCWLNPGC